MRPIGLSTHRRERSVDSRPAKVERETDARFTNASDEIRQWQPTLLPGVVGRYSARTRTRGRALFT
jgi:hypothetical protein